ncbi:MAG: hypothetical protein QXF42_03630 [Sulfolobales archaeon]
MDKLTKTLALITLAIVTISIIPAALVLVSLPLSAQAVVAITSSREPFGNKFWKNQTFYVDVWLTSKPADEITLMVRVKGTTYAVNATYITGTAYQFRTWFNVTAGGVIYANKSNPDGSIPSHGSIPSPENFTIENIIRGTLSEGDTVTVAYGDKSITLVFQHTEASLDIRKDVPYPVNATETGDFYIIAPDLNYNATGKDTISVNITITDYSIGKSWTATINFTETDVNSGKFVNTTLSSIYNYTIVEFGNGNAYEVAPGDYVEVKVSVYQYSGATDVDTVTTTLNVFSTIADVSVVRSDLGKLELVVKDLDENKNSTVKETVPLYVGLCDGSTLGFNMIETDKNTGEFKYVFKPYEWIARNGINASCNKVKVNVTTGYYHAINKTYALANVTKDVTISYYTADISVTPTEVIIGPAATITLTVNDKDLNLDPEAIDVWNITLSASELLKDKALNHSKFGALGLANLTIEAVRGDKSWPLNVSVPTTIVLTETDKDSGVFNARIDLGVFNWTNISSMIGGAPEKLVIKYVDIYTPELKSVTVKKEVLAAKPSITVDRDYIPLSTYDDIKLVAIVKDPAATGKGSISVTCTAYFYNGSAAPASACIVDSALETGVATGEFKVKVRIDNATITPALIGGKIVINYPDAGLTKEVPFRLYGVKFTVNGTSVVNVMYGDVIELVIEDPDRNLDTEVEDSFTITVGSVTFNFKETGKNTGVFKATYTVSGALGAPAKSVEIKYSDPTPLYATSAMLTWPDPEEYKVTVNIKSVTGELFVNDVKDYVEVGPVGKLVIVVKDADANREPDAVDYAKISIKKWDGTFILSDAPEAKETDKSTGVFEYKFDLSSLGNITDYVGKEIVVYYRDDYDATGKVTVKAVTVKIISWDGKIETDKKVYNIGERIKIKVIDKDANRNPDAIEVITADKVRISSTSDPIGTGIALVETDKNTGEFVGEVLISEIPGAGRVYAKLGDVITITYIDDLPADYGVTGKPKSITYTVNVGVPIEKPITPKKADFVDPKTGVSVIPKVGSMVGISVELSNVGVTDQVFTAILVVKDPAGVVVKVDSISIPLAAGKSGTVTFSYIPKLVGDYTVEVYVVKSLADWTPLGDMLTKVMSVVS